jgi:hypothetical protein
MLLDGLGDSGNLFPVMGVELGILKGPITKASR